MSEQTSLGGGWRAGVNQSVGLSVSSVLQFHSAARQHQDVTLPSCSGPHA